MPRRAEGFGVEGQRARAECPCHARRKKPPAKRVHKRRAGGFQMIKAQRVIGEQSERTGLLDSRSNSDTRRLGRGSAVSSELAYFATGPVECPELSGIACALVIRQPPGSGRRRREWPIVGARNAGVTILTGWGWPEIGATLGIRSPPQQTRSSRAWTGVSHPAGCGSCRCRSSRGTVGDIPRPGRTPRPWKSQSRCSPCTCRRSVSP